MQQRRYPRQRERKLEKNPIRISRWSVRGVARIESLIVEFKQAGHVEHLRQQ